MVITVHDPPEFDWKSLPVSFGAVVAPLAVIGVPRLRDVPALPALFFLAAISAAFVAGAGRTRVGFPFNHRRDLRAGGHWHPASVYAGAGRLNEQD